MAENQQKQNNNAQVSIRVHYRSGLFKSGDNSRNFYSLYGQRLYNNNYLRPKQNTTNRNYKRQGR